MPKLTTQQQIVLNAIDELLDKAGSGDVGRPLFGICANLNRNNYFWPFDYVPFFAQSWHHPDKLNCVINMIPQVVLPTGEYAHKWTGHQLQMRLSLLNHMKKNIHLLTKKALDKFKEDNDL